MISSASAKQLKEFLESLPPDTENQLSDLFESDSDLGVKRLVELAAQQGIQVTPDDVNAFLDQVPDPETTVSLDQFKTLKQSISPEIEQEITGLILTDYDSGVDRIVEVASSKGVTIPLEEVDILLDQLEDEAEESEDENIELDAVALTAVAGGRRKSRRGRRRRYASGQYHRQSTRRSGRRHASRRAMYARIASMTRRGPGRRW